MEKYKKGEEILIFKNKDYDCNVYPDCLVDETFREGEIIHYDETSGKYWARDSKGEEFFGRHYYDSVTSDKKDNAIIISRAEYIVLVYMRMKSLSKRLNDNIDYNMILLGWFNSNASTVKHIDDEIIAFDDRTHEYRIMANSNKYLEKGDTVCAFSCNIEKDDDKLECVLNALRSNNGFINATIESRVEDSKYSTYIATFGKDNERTLSGYYAKAYPGNAVFLRKQDLLRLVRAKSKELQKLIEEDEKTLKKIQKLYHELAGDIIGNEGYIPEVITTYNGGNKNKN